MGEVYRAQDTHLKREVAIKVLPEQFTQDAQRLARFEREAQLLASLSHPNIAAVYSFEHADDLHFLVMELVEGEDLSQKVSRGPLPVEEALQVCLQVAEGVEAAHEKGVIHRDLKPANVKVTPEGQVKVLDFGLAKALEGEIPAPDISQSPTLTHEMTRAGVILGTAAYMSPEQARGKAVDKRTDVWAFGCLLYECLTGQQVFGGETTTDILGAIVHKEPDWHSLPQNTPGSIRTLLRRCLEKDLSLRLRDIWDARIELTQSLSEPVAESSIQVVSGGQSPAWKWAIPWGVVGVIMVLAAWVVWNLTSPAPQGTTRFVITPPRTVSLGGASPNQLGISPDGRRIVFQAEYEGRRQLFLRSVDDFEARHMPGTEDAIGYPFFSPDGHWVAFFTGVELKKVPVSGGSSMVICRSPGSSGGIWKHDGTIIAGSRSGLWRVSSAGGVPETVTTPDVERGERGHLSPQILPHGDVVLFTVMRESEPPQIATLSLQTRETTTILEGGRQAYYVPTGHLVYSTNSGTLMAVPFDATRLEVTGEPVPVLEGVRRTPPLAADFSLSGNGTLVYVSGQEDGRQRTVVWVGRDGQAEPLAEEPLENPRYPRISPDGRQLSLTVGPGGAGSIWIYDLEGRPPYPLMGNDLSASRSVWAPGGKQVAFASGRNPPGLFLMQADRSTMETELLVSSPNRLVVRCWSSDGKELIFLEAGPEGNDLMALSLEGERKPRLVVRTEYPYNPGDSGAGAALSPDGQWLAYMSGLTGGPEIWVRPYPGPGAPTRISPNGGREPLWGRDGREIFYLEDDKLMAVDVQTQPDFRFEPAKMLFDEPYRHASRPSYDVGLDGRFVMIQPVEQQAEEAQIRVIQNWFEELKRLVPTDN